MIFIFYSFYLITFISSPSEKLDENNDWQTEHKQLLRGAGGLDVDFF